MGRRRSKPLALASAGGPQGAMAHRGGNNNNNNDDANAPGGGEEDDLAFPVQIGLMPVPVPARHCRAFRTGFCTADPCRDLHLTCPDGRTRPRMRVIDSAIRRTTYCFALASSSGRLLYNPY